ncbi:MAG: alpha/beta hydrolase, partial [Pyrinomonadaceae bacterium]|nr:alpha/beta hydrolase [Sphingobacteriaceae bacterium]
MKNRIYSFSFLVLTLVFLNFSCKKNVTTNNYIKTSLQYKTIAGVPATLLSLDVYSYAQNASPKPVIIWVHGGGWRIGDKSNKLDNKLNLFNSLNYVFISVNYRLSPNPSEISNINRIKYPDHNNDVADAVKWVRNNIAAYGGDPSKMLLLGHSAGGHLVSLTGTSQQFLPARGFLLSMLKGIASIDTEGYDVPSQSGEELYQNAFGTDNNIQMQASPIYNVSSSFSYPRFFIAKRGTPVRIALA